LELLTKLTLLCNYKHMAEIESVSEGNNSLNLIKKSLNKFSSLNFSSKISILILAVAVLTIPTLTTFTSNLNNSATTSQNAQQVNPSVNNPQVEKQNLIDQTPVVMSDFIIDYDSNNNSFVVSLNNPQDQSKQNFDSYISQNGYSQIDKSLFDFVTGDDSNNNYNQAINSVPTQNNFSSSVLSQTNITSSSSTTSSEDTELESEDNLISVLPVTTPDFTINYDDQNNVFLVTLNDPSDQSKQRFQAWISQNGYSNIVPDAFDYQTQSDTNAQNTNTTINNLQINTPGGDNSSL